MFGDLSKRLCHWFYRYSPVRRPTQRTAPITAAPKSHSSASGTTSASHSARALLFPTVMQIGIAINHATDMKMPIRCIRSLDVRSFGSASYPLVVCPFPLAASAFQEK
jgi:hypothetical protein